MRTSQQPVANAATGSAAGLGRTALGTATGQRLPVPPRERKPALAALAVLLILGGALTSAYLVIASGERISAIRIVRPVAAGQPVPVDAMAEVQVGDTGADYYIRWTERFKVARAYAAVPLVPGALLSNGMVSETDVATKGRLIVGLALKPGQFPAGELAVGKRVGLYAVGGQGGQAGGGVRPGTTLSSDATVVAIARSGRDGVRADQTLVSVAVPPEQAAQITQAASAGSVAVALVPLGTAVPNAPAGPAGPAATTRPERTATLPPAGRQSTPPGGPAGTNPGGG